MTDGEMSTQIKPFFFFCTCSQNGHCHCGSAVSFPHGFKHERPGGSQCISARKFAWERVWNPAKVVSSPRVPAVYFMTSSDLGVSFTLCSTRVDCSQLLPVEVADLGGKNE